MQYVLSGVHWYLIYYSSQYQKTALYYASEGGHHDSVRVLLESGADPNTCDIVSVVDHVCT